LKQRNATKPRPVDNTSNKNYAVGAPNCNKPRYIQIIFKRCDYRKPNSIPNMFHDKRSVNKIKCCGLALLKAYGTESTIPADTEGQRSG